MSNKTKPKPRVMWARPHRCQLRAIVCHPSKIPGVAIKHVAVIPLADVEAIVERAATAFLNHDSALNYGRIRAALTAAGIPCKQRRARK